MPRRLTPPYCSSAPLSSLVAQLRRDARFGSLLIGDPAGRPAFADWWDTAGASGVGVPYLAISPSAYPSAARMSPRASPAAFDREQTFVGFEGYDTVVLFAAALAQTGADRGVLRHALEHARGEATRGELSFDDGAGVRHHQWVWRPVRMLTAPSPVRRQVRCKPSSSTGDARSDAEEARRRAPASHATRPQSGDTTETDESVTPRRIPPGEALAGVSPVWKPLRPVGKLKVSRRTRSVMDLGDGARTSPGRSFAAATALSNELSSDSRAVSDGLAPLRLPRRTPLPPDTYAPSPSAVGASAWKRRYKPGVGARTAKNGSAQHSFGLMTSRF
jgi:hypothetical protein